MTTAGLVHTVPSLAADFDQRLRSHRPDLDLLHLVDASMLERAVAIGQADAVVLERLRLHVRHLLDAGAERVLVTCSSLGTLADELVRHEHLPVERVDRAMAEQAVALALEPARATTIQVLATQPSTLVPTGDLVRQAVADQHPSSPPTVLTDLVDDAAAARAAGNQDQHDALVREAVAHAQQHADVVVLAQASMLTALAQARPTSVPVLTSPDSGVERFLSGLPGAAAG